MPRLSMPLLRFAFAIAALATFAARAAATVREPAVAGLFYPRDPAQLSRTIDQLLAAATPAAGPAGQLRAIIVPHAGYAYSGHVAASAYALLRGQHFETVVLLAPSHYALLDRASVSGADAYRTPLGDVPVSAQARELAHHAPFALDPVCDVERPAWASQSSRPLPAPGTERADTWEHAGEVELPFLQKTLDGFALMPVVMGEVDPVAAARSLAPRLDDHALLVVSSDLSHYHPYAQAQALDHECVAAILALDTRRVTQAEACGRIPILTLLEIAKTRGWQPVLLDARNSGDTSGDKSRVVGYASIAFFEAASVAPASPHPEAASETLTAADRTALLALSRRALREVVRAHRLPDFVDDEISPALRRVGASFVTLTKQGELRGCIGSLRADAPLFRDVAENTRHAALEDPRFAPVTAAEVDDLQIEISVLSRPEPVAFASSDELLRKLHPGRDGVVLRVNGRTATYLPQVWEQVPDKIEFMNSLAEKAGLPAAAWRESGAQVQIYHVESFHEGQAPAPAAGAHR